MALRQIQTRYSKFILDASKNSSKIGLPIQQSDLHTFPCKRTSILRNSSAFQKRFYFKNREYDDQGYWFHNPKRVGLALFFFSCGVAIAVSSGKSVTVPYTGRSHFILFYKLEKMLEEEYTTYEGELLPPFHPYSITARRIFQDIIDQAFPVEIEIKRSLEEKENEYEDKSNCEIIILDWPQDLIAGSGQFGKIYVSSALLHHYRNHEEMLATIFGGEIGHDLARHNHELISKLICLVSGIGMTLYLFTKSAYIRSKFPYFDKFMRLRFLPSISLVVSAPLLSYVVLMMYHRRMEIEADHIGLMLAASAGYNPEVGVLYPVYGDELNQTVLPECLSFFPTERTRNVYLARPQVLDEAIFRYRQSTKPSGTSDST